MTTVRDQLIQMLQTVAQTWETICVSDWSLSEAAHALFITDEIVLEAVRATDDVDLIVDLVGRAQWAQLQDQLRQKGFAESPEDEVICSLGLMRRSFLTPPCDRGRPRSPAMACPDLGYPA